MNMSERESLQHATAPPVFILSCERSGSTLLRYIVDTHEQICCPGQLYLGQLCRDLHTTIFYSLGQTLGTASEEERGQLIAAEVRRVVDELMSKYATAKGKRMWCDKTTLNLQHLKILNAVFPDAKCICLYRHSMDVVYSSIECSRLGFMPELAPYVQKNPANIVAAMVENWIDKTGTLLAFEREHPERCFRIKYEDVVLNPTETLRRMFTFLNLEWSDTLIDAIFTAPHDAGSGDRKILFSKKIEQNSLGKGSTLPHEDIPDDLLGEMNRLLEELNYPIVGADWGSARLPFLPAASETGGREILVTTVKEIFERHFPKLLTKRKEDLRAMNGVCKFVLSGEGGGVWTLSFAAADWSIAAEDTDADCTVEAPADVLLDLVNGKLNAVAAFDQGKLYVIGNFELANHIGQLLFGG
ncbi:MAG TPA: sulfotransferase [Pyrinomonadaceae bacterium]|jgi:putative sterol carrier protein